MKVNNMENSTPHFGMAIKINSSNFPEKISKRIKNGDDIQKLEKIFERANKNDVVDVYLGTEGNGRIWANLAERRPVGCDLFNSGTPYSYSFQEGFLSKLFRNPVNLIDDLVFKAEHKAEEIESARKLEEAIKKAVSES